VVPLSAAAKFPFAFKMMIIGIIVHILCVGIAHRLGGAPLRGIGRCKIYKVSQVTLLVLTY